MQSGQARVLWEKNRSAFCLEGFICLLLKVISFEGSLGNLPCICRRAGNACANDSGQAHALREE